MKMAPAKAVTIGNVSPGKPHLDADCGGNTAVDDDALDVFGARLVVEQDEESGRVENDAKP
jgi:hypothetical protein